MNKEEKFAISNIAWRPHEEKDVFALMQEYGFSGLEVAPTKIFPNPIEISAHKVTEYRKQCESYGIEIVAMQSLLFGHPELQIFAPGEAREKTINYLTGIIKFGSLLDVETVVFGSPKNRIVPDEMSQQQAGIIAESFFSEMGHISEEYGMYFCIEPNPPFYGGNFVTSSQEGIDLVKRVNHPHFRFHLDTGTLFMNDEDAKTVITTSRKYIKHCHASDAGLTVITQGENRANHTDVAEALKKAKYNGWVSIEMRPNSDVNASNLDNIRQSLAFVKNIYGK